MPIPCRFQYERGNPHNFLRSSKGFFFPLSFILQGESIQFVLTTQWRADLPS